MYVRRHVQKSMVSIHGPPHASWRFSIHMLRRVNQLIFDVIIDTIIVILTHSFRVIDIHVSVKMNLIDYSGKDLFAEL